MISIFANPGQAIRLVIETKNSDGYRVDGYTPTVDSVYFPNGSAASGYPASMTALETGLYYRSVTLPIGSTALGTFIASCSWTHPTTAIKQYEVFLIQVAMPFGNSNVIGL